MAIVTSYDWESDTFTHHAETQARKAWREAVAEVADKARAKLPECSGRVDSAVKIVLGAYFSPGRAGIAAKMRYAFGLPRQGFQRRPLPDAMPS